MYNFEPYNVLLAIATNIPVLLMTAFSYFRMQGVQFTTRACEAKVDPIV